MSTFKYAITTIDNPYNPFTQFDAWYNYDLNRELTHRDELYVNCCSILDRYTLITDNMSEAEVDAAIENAIDEIIKYDVANVYCKVKYEVPDVEDIEPEDKSYLDNMSTKFLNREQKQ